MTTACHMLGEWDRELEEAHRGLGYFPKVLEMREPEVRALAALGRVEELERVVEESLVLPSGPLLMVG